MMRIVITKEGVSFVDECEGGGVDSLMSVNSNSRGDQYCDDPRWWIGRSEVIAELTEEEVKEVISVIRDTFLPEKGVLK